MMHHNQLTFYPPIWTEALSDFKTLGAVQRLTPLRPGGGGYNIVGS